MQKPESDKENQNNAFTEEEPLEMKILIRGQEDELLKDITESLKEQVNAEIEPKTADLGTRAGRKRKGIRIFLGTASVLIACILILVLTPMGRGLLFKTISSYAYGQMNHDESLSAGQEATPTPEVQITDVPSVTPSPTQSAIQQEEEEDTSINLLLLGEESIESGSAKGRTDIMMIATLDTKAGCIKLTSLMRDMLVDIPGYQSNKLNTAYEYGGVPLLYETLSQNFGIRLDGYMLVGFDAFEAIIDKLGGVNITLTDKEADYLNTTNYISKAEYRNVVPGTQLLNGNQALGYCRIRYVATGNHEMNDFGRTSRQRVLLDAIYDKYKTKNLAELALMANGILPFITTDLAQEEFTEYLSMLVSIKGGNLETLRIPADNTFDEGTVRGMSVLIPNKEKNAELLQEFIGEKK